MKTIKILSIVGLLAAAMASQAFAFVTEESGNFSTATVGNTTNVTSTFDVYVTQGAGFSFATGTLDYSYAGLSVPVSGEAVTGTVTLAGTNPADSLSYIFNGTIYGGASGDSEGLSGAAVLTGSTGVYAQYTNGTGVVTNMSIYLGPNGNGAPSGTTYGSFAGDFQAVPSPVGIAFLGLGIVALAVRRRSA